MDGIIQIATLGYKCCILKWDRRRSFVDVDCGLLFLTLLPSPSLAPLFACHIPVAHQLHLDCLASRLEQLIKDSPSSLALDTIPDIHYAAKKDGVTLMWRWKMCSLWSLVFRRASWARRRWSYGYDVLSQDICFLYSWLGHYRKEGETLDERTTTYL